MKPLRSKMKHANTKKKLFKANGTEGMLDVVLGCTLIFLLLTALVKVDAGKSQEIALPDMDLTRASTDAKGGASNIKRTIISLKRENEQTKIWIDKREVPQAELTAELQKLGPSAQVALRRDQDLPCRIEDDIILACQEAGIQRVAIMIQEKENTQ